MLLVRATCGIIVFPCQIAKIRLRVQGRREKNFFDFREVSRQAFGVRVAKKHFEHFAITAHAERKWIVAECRCLSFSIVAFEVEVSGTAEMGPLVRRLFALAKDFI